MLISCRLRTLREEPYTQKEAEAAAGLRTDNGATKTLTAQESEEKEATMDVESTQEG